MNCQLLSCGAVEAGTHIPVSTKATVSDGAGPAGGAGGAENQPLGVWRAGLGSRAAIDPLSASEERHHPHGVDGTLRLRGVQGLASGHRARMWQARLEPRLA